MDHLREIEDAAARDGVKTFQAQMEVVVLSMLHEDRGIALTQIEEARAASLAYTDGFHSAYLSPAERAKAKRVATTMLGHSFQRLRAVIAAPDDDEPAGAPAN